jgi:hypothetical protein
VVAIARRFAVVPSSPTGSALFTYEEQRRSMEFCELCHRLCGHRIGVAVVLGLGLALGGCGSGGATAKPSATPQGADPVAWMGVFCGGLDQVIDAGAAAAKPPPTPQGEKDALVTQADATQQALTTTAQKLTQLGAPGITDGKQAQDNAVGFFTTAANAIADRRTKLAALDANDPNFEQKKAEQLAGPDLGSQVQGLISNNELAPAFGKAPQCQQLGATAAPS